MNPLLRALRELGGSGTIDEINAAVYQVANIPEEVIAIPHGAPGGRGEVAYRLAWARTYLGKYGALENSSRGVWAIRSEFNAETVDPKEVIRVVRALDGGEEVVPVVPVDKAVEPTVATKMDVEPAAPQLDSWEDRLMSVLLDMAPEAFERLVQRLLREAGFTQVLVTGRTGDQGIDGKGIARVNDFLSFHVLFQCKRYRNSVGPADIRDFRGAMQGRADRGLFITTGTFTRQAAAEAARDGAPPIDLIDGELLAQKLKQYGLGLRTEIVERIVVDEAWFRGL